MTQQKVSAFTHPYYRTERTTTRWIGKRDIFGWTYWRDVALLTPEREEKGTDCKGTECFCVFLTLYTILQRQTHSSTDFLKQNLVYCWSNRSKHEKKNIYSIYMHAEAEFYIFGELEQEKRTTQKEQPVAVPLCWVVGWALQQSLSALSLWQPGCCDCCWQPVWSGCGTSLAHRHQSLNHWSKSCSPSPQSSVQTEVKVKENKLIL